MKYYSSSAYQGNAVASLSMGSALKFESHLHILEVFKKKKYFMASSWINSPLPSRRLRKEITAQYQFKYNLKF